MEKTQRNKVGRVKAFNIKQIPMVYQNLDLLVKPGVLPKQVDMPEKDKYQHIKTTLVDDKDGKKRYKKETLTFENFLTFDFDIDFMIKELEIEFEYKVFSVKELNISLTNAAATYNKADYAWINIWAERGGNRIEVVAFWEQQTGILSHSGKSLTTKELRDKI